MKAILFLLGFLPAFGADVAVIQLKDSTEKALRVSSRMAAAWLEHEAAEERAKAARAGLFPRLLIEGSARYVTEVPTLAVVPGRELPFGDNESYSIGPTVQWNIWDSGAVYNAWRSAQSQEESKRQEGLLAERQVRLAAELAYLKVVSAAEQMRLVADSYRLANAQAEDLGRRHAAGAVSRIELLSAEREAMGIEIQLRQAQSELSASLRDLVVLTGESGGADVALSNPLDSRVSPSRLPEGFQVSIVVRLDSIPDLMTKLEQGLSASGGAHPQLLALASARDAGLSASRSASAAHWPRVQLFARSSLDYPNGPVLDNVHQNSAGVTLSWSLFEGGRAWYDAGEKRAAAGATEQRLVQARTELGRDRQKTMDQVAALKAQLGILKESVRRAEEIAKLVGAQYDAGRARLLDMQAANLKALEARIQSVRSEVQVLVQLAVLRSFSDRETVE